MQYAIVARQKGATLFVGLIMLVLMTLVGIVAYNMTRQNSLIAGNMLARQQGVNAAIQATDVAISNGNFTANPGAVFTGSCGGNKYCVDINNDGTPDITVSLAPRPCVKTVKVIPNTQLDVTKPQDLACAVGAGQTLGIAGASSGASLCADSVWEVNATATDVVTQASTTVTTGVANRVAKDDAQTAANACP